MKISDDDEQNLHRLLDGELTPAAAAAMEARLAAEPELQRECDERRRLRTVLAAAKNGTFSAPAGFTASVLAATRRLPSRHELEQQDIGERIVGACRRLLIAAAVVVGLGAVWHSGLLRSGNDATLEAAPDEIQTEMDRLDSLIEPRAIGERKAK